MKYMIFAKAAVMMLAVVTVKLFNKERLKPLELFVYFLFFIFALYLIEPSQANATYGFGCIDQWYNIEHHLKTAQQNFEMAEWYGEVLIKG